MRVDLLSADVILAIVAGESATMTAQLGLFAVVYVVRLLGIWRVYLPSNWTSLAIWDRLVPAFVLGLTPFLLHALWQRGRSAYAFAHHQWHILPIDEWAVFYLPVVVAGLAAVLWSVFVRVFGCRRGPLLAHAANLVALAIGVAVAAVTLP